MSWKDIRLLLLAISTYPPLTFLVCYPLLATQFKFRLTSDHTASLCLSGGTGREPLAVWFRESWWYRLCGAVWGWVTWNCWYWVWRTAPGIIHQKGAVCTVGIDMNNPCSLYPSQSIRCRMWGILAFPLVSAVRIVYLFESVCICSTVHLFLPDIYTHLCMSGRYKTAMQSSNQFHSEGHFEVLVFVRPNSFLSIRSKCLLPIWPTIKYWFNVDIHSSPVLFSVLWIGLKQFRRRHRPWARV